MGSIAGITLSHALGWVPGWPAGFPPALTERVIAGASLTLALTYLAWMSESRIERLLNHLEGERKRFHERSIRDSLTGLANRTMIFDSLVASDARCRRHGLRGAFFFIDLDGFKAINDAHGHTGGDHVLVEVARRLSGLVRLSDMAGRLGGDEFALIVEGTPSPTQAAVLADRVYRALSDPIDLETGPVRVGASIGVAFYPEASSQREGGHAQLDAAERTIKAADLAMYHAKRSGQPFSIREEDGSLESADLV